jgi:hypothetical protein
MNTELPILSGTGWGGSKLKAFQKCKRYYWLTQIKDGTGIEKTTIGEPLSFGNAIHQGLFRFYHGLVEARRDNMIEALIAESIHAAVALAGDNTPTDTDKELFSDQVISCLDQYFEHYKEEIYSPNKGMQPVIPEVPISIELGGFNHTGRLDLLANYGGHLCIPDHKTTGMDWARFFKRWKFDLSLRGYVLAHYKHTGQILSVLINGIRRKGDKAMTCEFQRDLIHYDEQEMQETEAEIIDIRQDIARRNPANLLEWPKTGDACQQMFECDMRGHCLHPDVDSVRYKNKEPKDGGLGGHPSSAV